METNLRVTAEILYISRSIDNMQLHGTCLKQQNLLNNKLNSLTISIHSPTTLTVCDFCKYYYISIWEAVADFSSCINVQGNQTPKYCPFTTLMSRERGTACTVFYWQLCLLFCCPVTNKTESILFSL